MTDHTVPAPAAARARETGPTIAALLTRPEAYAISLVLAEEAASIARGMVDLLEDVTGLDVFSIDAQAHGRRLTRLLTGLEQIGWPHTHAWPECDRILAEAEEDYSPWEAANVIATRREAARRERAANPVTGDTLLTEILAILDERLPDLPAADPARTHFAGLRDTLRAGLDTPTPPEED
jgi:hypothetical protein